MGRSLAIFVALTLLSAIFVGITLGLGYRLAIGNTPGARWRWLFGWAGKGLFLPALLWPTLNFGLSLRLQPLMPEVQAARLDGGAWIPIFLHVTGEGWFIIASYWAVVTLGWALLLASRDLEGEPRANFRALCITCGLGMLLPGLGIVLLGGWPTAGLAGMLLVGPMAVGAPSFLVKKQIPPMYSRAIAKIKFGKYSEAEWEIIRQLEKREDDFDGWIMMAELYANHFHDLGEAEQTILEICNQPRTTPPQVSIALHKLADWQLKIAGDPDAARRALNMLTARMPGTHLAHMATLRIRQIPENAEELRRRQIAEPIPLPTHDPFDQPASGESGIDRDHALRLANECISRLELEPNDIQARERLSRLLAERLDNPDMALEQLGLLLKLPGQSAAKRAEWLGLQAAWNLTYRQDAETGRLLLEQLIHEFPDSPQAFAARRRLQSS